ncbi:MAG: hypothetical protein AABY22_23205, partial [Nanoarchaeota archaeon]
VRPEDALAQDILLCVSMRRKQKELDRIRYVDTPTMYLRSSEEMWGLFADIPDACQNTLEIAGKCNANWLDIGQLYFPKWQGQTSLIQNTRSKVYARYPKPLSELLVSRIKYELEVIKNKGFEDYFLIVSDILAWCRTQNILYKFFHRLQLYIISTNKY